MKTKTQFSALLLVIAIMFATNSFASKKNIDFEEESYIDDIPFNTEWVVSELMMLSFDYENEAYVDDIPFNTAEIASNYYYKLSTAVKYELDEEEYVDDIPFNTEWIANELLNESVDFEEEAFIDDLPFNTKMIAAMSIDYNQEDEEYIDDIPFETCEIAKEMLVDIACVADLR